MDWEDVEWWKVEYVCGTAGENGIVESGMVETNGSAMWNSVEG